MSYIKNLIADIDKTHANLGKLIAIQQICVKARKFMLVVSPSGCGKSVGMNFICQNTPNSWQPTQLSVASLALKTEKLTSFRSVIGVDDISSIQTSYARTTTITTLSQLVYTHRVEPSMAGFDFVIEDFYGSAIMGIQPVMLRDVVASPEWEGSIKDKALRYYHLYRPLEPNNKLPMGQFEYGIDIDSFDFEPDLNSDNWRKLYMLALSQWSRARAKEHIVDFLKAIASLENRKEVIDEDYDLLYDLLKPMSIEKIVMQKDSLEGSTYLDNSLLALLVEYYTYNGEFALGHIVLDFNIQMAYAYRIMASQNGNWQQISKSPTLYRPSKHLLEQLKEYNLEVKNEN